MRHTARFIAILVLLVLAGCVGSQTRPSSFYVLSVEKGAPVTTTQAVSLGLGPVTLPDVLERPQIVTRPDPNRIDLAEYDRWGGELNKDLSRVLVQNLMQRLGTDNVVQYPAPGSSQTDLEVSIDFFRFDGVPGQSAQLQGTWRLVDGKQGCEPGLYPFAIEEPAQGAGYHALVAAMSRGVGRLSDQIAQGIAASTSGCPR